MSDTTLPDTSAVTGTLLDVIRTRSWADDLQVGRGYEYVTGKAMVSALPTGLSVTESKASKKKFETRFIRSVSDFTRELSGSVSGSGVVDGITVKGSVDYLNKVRYSSVSSTLVASYIEHQADFDRISRPSLTEDARSRIEYPADFRNVYGDYFVSGTRIQNEFHAIYVLRAQSESSLNQFHAAVGAQAPEVFTADASAKFLSNAKTHGIEVDVYIDMSATAGVPPAKPGAGGSYSPGSVLAMLQWFQGHADGGNQVAELTHYTALHPDFPRTIPVPPSFFASLAGLDASLADVRRLFDALPNQLQGQHQSALDQLTALATNSRSSFEQDPSLMQDVIDRVTALHGQCAPLAEFFARLRALSSGGGASSVGGHGGAAGIGRNGDTTTVPTGLKVESTWKGLSKQWASGHVTGVIQWERPGARIVSLDVSSRWSTDTRGHLVSFAGGIGADHVRIGFEAEFDTGLSWRTDIQYVDCD